ncbi:MAG TPA: hypothetical protein VNT76_20335 [Candidatus Binatus sp.]|nr:hypothetical protein [Candidatus Binatus sp.]
MRTDSYNDHRIDFDSEEVRQGEWIARATIVFLDQQIEKRIPILGRRQATFDTRELADAYALELAKLWIDGKLSGSNGHGLPD